MDADILLIYELFIVLFILLSCFFSGTEVMLVSSGRVAIETLSRKNPRRGQRAIFLLNNIEDAISAVVIGNTIVNITATVFITYVASQAFKLNENGIFIVTVCQALIFLLLCEITPKIVARAKAEKYLLFFSFPIKCFLIFCKPFNAVRLLFSSGLKKILRIEQSYSSLVSREELDILFQIGAKDGIIDDEHHMYISGILSFKELTAYEIMTPTIDIVSVELKTSLKNLVQLIESTRYSRIPVFDKRVDNIAGYVFYRDIFSKKDAKTIQELMHPARYVPSTKNIFDLLIEMRDENISIVFVVNEYGAVVGMVSNEDIAEKIVGEIHTFDHGEDELIMKVSDREYMLSGDLDIDHFKKIFMVDIEKKGFETIAGFIMHQLGRIPQQGESFKYGKYSFAVDSMAGRSITKAVFKSKSKIRVNA
ncbi:MAG: hemolysin family protein [Leptospirales bacterium]|nr:hemolysin family protein [Leptospirales bacterium]